MNNENEIKKVIIKVSCKNKYELTQIADDIRKYSKDIELIVNRTNSRSKYKIRGQIKVPEKNNILAINTKCLDLEDKFSSYLKSIDADYTVTHLNE